MENIIEPTFDFNFSRLYLGSPISTSGGSYFTKILYNNKSLYVQTPKSLTKQGFIKNNKKIYVDLMFTNFDNLFIDWIERLQNKCEELLYDRGQTWFETKLEKDDIETAFTSPIKIFKSGKNYLIRVNAKNGLKIYDESNNLIELENMTNDKNIISILEIQGIKFTSKNFQIEIELKQAMIVSSDPFLDKCLIKNPNKNSTESSTESLMKNINITNNDLKEELSDGFFNENIFSKNLPKVDSSLPKVDSSLPKVDSSLPKVDSSLPKVDSSLPKVNSSSLKDKNIQKNDAEQLINLNLDELIGSSINDLVSKETNLPNNEFIQLDMEDFPMKNEMTEIDISIDNFGENDESIKLKNRSQVYQEIYQKAKEKAKELKNATIVAYMELKNIKSMYMLDDVCESDSDVEELNSIDLDDEII
jgi:hypothetical protein